MRESVNPGNERDYWDSSDCIYVDIPDVPEAHDVKQRPIPDSVRKIIMAEREKILRWGGYLGPGDSEEKKP